MTYRAATLETVFAFRRALILAALLLALVMPLAGCSCGGASQEGPPTEDVADAEDPSGQSEEDESPTTASASVTQPATAPAGSPQAALEAYIRAQEDGDWAATADCLVEAAQDEFDEATEDMTADDLIESGLRIHEEHYQLESSDDTTAIFFSRKANLYLVMTKEEGQWKIDPAKTDQLNLETD